MATKTSVGSGLWSAAGTWDLGVPADTDTVIISAGHSVEFDVDQTLFGSGVDLTINGTLYASTTAGSYVLKMSANMDGSGTLRAGTEAVPYPMTCVFEIMRNGFSISANNMTLDLNCTEPTYRYARCTGAEAAGQTVLEIDTNVTGDIWAAGDTIHINDADGFGIDTEERVIAAGGIAAGAITITAGLTNAKTAGALVILITRNVRITHTARTNQVVLNVYTDSRVYAQVSGAATGYQGVRGFSIGGVVSNVNNAFYISYGIAFYGVVSNAIFGINSCYAPYLSSDSLMSACASALSTTIGFVVKGTLSGNNVAMSTSDGTLYGAFFSGNATDISMNTEPIRGYRATLDGITQVSIGALPAIGRQQVSIWDIGGVPGAFKAWMRGGRVQSQAGVVPTGRVVAYQHICESASYPVFMDRFAEVEAGDTFTATVWLRKDAAMPGYLPRCQLFRIENDPLLGGAVLDAATMTDSIDTWEEFELEWTNTTAGPVTVVLRTLGMAAANNIYADSLILNGGEEVGGGSPFTGVFG